MSVNIVSFSMTGGAGNVATALLEGFAHLGFTVNLTVATKGSLLSNPLERPTLTLYASLDKYLIRDRKWPTLVSVYRDRYSALEDTLDAADLTIFRWMNGLLGERFLRDNPQVNNLVWGLDDMNPFTGACHYSGQCRGFETGCQSCPALRKQFAGAAQQNLARKIEFARRFNPTFVAPTNWIHEQFELSLLANSSQSAKIPNPIQSRFFADREPRATNSAQIRFLVIAANLDDPTKGVWNVVNELHEVFKQTSITLTFVGRASEQLRARLPMANFLGNMNSESILGVLGRHDVLLVPSLFENAGTVVAEAASQGLPTIARNVGGMPEMTNFGETGYLFSDSSELAQIITTVSKSEIMMKGKLAKEWAQQMRPEVIATKYAEAFLR